MTILFISDLHLGPSYPKITDCLLRFLEDEAPKASALYVLGDLFEFWIGDDDLTPLHQTVIAAFQALSEKGVPLYFIHGNRDFMIGKAFAKTAGITLLPEHFVMDLFGTPTLIMHGDTLCIQDESYQKYRKKVHNPVLQFFYSCLPLSFRRKIGDKIRKRSEEKKGKVQSSPIMDVCQDEVIRVMSEEGVTQLIHGHTHRPDIHVVPLKIDHGDDQKHSQEDHQGRRIVLGDWFTQGSVLRCNEDGCTLETLPFKK